MRKLPKYVYAMYFGDKFLDMGTMEELAKRNDITLAALKFRATPTYRRRCQEAGRETYYFVNVGKEGNYEGTR